MRPDIKKRDYNRGRQLEEKVAAYIEKNHMIKAGDKILTGLSGGADSVCLFYMLLSLRKRFDFSFEAVHVNHMLRRTAGRDEDFVAEICSKEGICLHREQVDVTALAKKEGMTLEEAGRKARYEIFRRLASERGAVSIGVAHHANDQAETILFHLCRGSGIEGLAGMRPVRGEIIRPLLCLERAEIEEYLRIHDISYVTDETNEDNAYSRNRLRNCILPELDETICHGTISHIARTGEVVSEAFDYLEGQIQKAFESCREGKVGDEAQYHSLKLLTQPLQSLHPYLQKEVIRLAVYSVSGSKKDISEVHVRGVLNLLAAQTGSQCHLPYQIRVSKSYHRLIFEKEMGQEKAGGGEPDSGKPEFFRPISREQLEQGQEGLLCPLPDGRKLAFRLLPYDKAADIPRNSCTKWLDYDKIEEPLLVRTPEEGDFFYFNDKNRKFVKDYMVNEKIPLGERDKSVLVLSGNHMLYFPGRRISNYFKVDDYTKRILEIKVQEDE